MSEIVLMLERPFATESRKWPMKPIDKAGMRARKSVADRMRMFVATLMGRFTTTSEEVLQHAQSEQLIDAARRKEHGTAAG